MVDSDAPGSPSTPRELTKLLDEGRRGEALFMRTVGLPEEMIGRCTQARPLSRSNSPRQRLGGGPRREPEKSVSF